MLLSLALPYSAFQVSDNDIKRIQMTDRQYYTRSPLGRNIVDYLPSLTVRHALRAGTDGSSVYSTYYVYTQRADATLIAVCWLEVSTHAENPATGHLDTGFVGFPLPGSKY
jgi:hypothetical protein